MVSTLTAKKKMPMIKANTRAARLIRIPCSLCATTILQTVASWPCGAETTMTSYIARVFFAPKKAFLCVDGSDAHDTFIEIIATALPAVS